MKDYRRLHEALVRLGATKMLLSAWYVCTPQSAGAMAEYLGQFVDPNDCIIVTETAGWAVVGKPLA
ncbi:MAG: hypothetical protein WHT63_08465 [Tepidiforma sp.]